MSDNFFNNADEFKKLFEHYEDYNFNNYMPLRDRKVGFSVQKNYLENIRYFPPKLKDGNPDVVALIHVVYIHPSEAVTNINSNQIPIYIRIGPHSKYLAEHHDYDFTDDNCPTRESIEKSKSTTKPISLEFVDDFHFNHDNNSFIDENRNTVKGIEVLNTAFNKHCETVHWRKGFKLRYQIKTHNYINTLKYKTTKVIIDLLKWILKTPLGRTLEPSDPYASILNGYSKNDLKYLKTDTMDVFGYRTSKNVIVTSSLLLFLGYTFLFFSGIKSQFIKGMFSNSFLAVINWILIEFILEKIIPPIILWILNVIIKKRSIFKGKKFKF